MSPEISGKALLLLKEAVPALHRVVPVRPIEGQLTERRAGVQPPRRQGVFMPLSGRRPGCTGGSPTQV